MGSAAHLLEEALQAQTNHPWHGAGKPYVCTVIMLPSLGPRFRLRYHKH